MIRFGRARPLILMLILLLSAPSWNAGAGEPGREGKALLQRMQKLVDNLKSMEADFVQLVENSGQENQESRGHFSAARPGRFRWDYRSPAEQLIVSDGHVVWYYEADLKQATRSGVDRVRETPATFFTNGGAIEDTFTWEVVTGTSWSGPVMRLRPKKEGSVKEILIAIDGTKDKILGLEVLDNLGHRSHIFFNNLVQNGQIPLDRFNFDPPAGVDVVEDMQGGR